MAKDTPQVLSDCAGISTIIGELGKPGRFTDDIFSRIKSGDQAFIDELASLAADGGIRNLPAGEQPIFDALDKECYFGVRDWSNRFGQIDTLRMGAFPELPWDISLLHEPCPFFPRKKIWETHFLFLGLDLLDQSPLTLGCIQKLLSKARGEYKPQLPMPSLGTTAKGRYWFSEASCTFKWYLMPKQPLAWTNNWVGRVDRFIPAKYEVPRAIERAMCYILHFSKYGTFPSENSSEKSSGKAGDRFELCLETTVNGGIGAMVGQSFQFCGSNAFDLRLNDGEINAHISYGIPLSRIPGQ